MTEQALWTVLPNGLTSDGRGLRASIFVSPRLVAKSRRPVRLASFPLFAHWPQVAGAIKVKLAIDGIGVVEAGPDPGSPSPEADLWDQLFGPDVPVRSHRFDDLSSRRILSYPVGDVLAAVLDLYRQTAGAHPTDFPGTGAIGSLAGKFGSALVEVAGDPVALDRAIDRSRRDPSTAEEAAFLEAERFYTRPGTRDPYRESPEPGRPAAPRPEADLDFHAVIAFLADYPRLLRQLGLVLDVVADLPPGMPATGAVRAVLEGPADAAELFGDEFRPSTSYVLDPPRFLARPRAGSDLVDGMLAIERSGFVAYELDVDGSALKLINQRLAQERSPAAETESLPALRSGGITVARAGRADQLRAQLEVAKALAANLAGKKLVGLSEDDVTRGFRIEVDQGGGWRSLCDRTASYRIERPRRPPQRLQVEADDEGFVKGPSTTSVPGDSDLYLHEAVFGWDGWSLVAPRPGRTIGLGEAPETVPARPETPVPLVVESRPRPGSLPRLRFGETYRLRVRAVDLAGNSVSRDAVHDGHEASVTYRRFEPVPSPAVVPHRAFTEGESLRRLVIRSAGGLSPRETPEQYAQRPDIQALAGHGIADARFADRHYEPVNTRLLLAPIASAHLIERHGRLDGGIGPGRSPADQAAALALARREGSTFYDRPAAQVLDNTGAFGDLPAAPGEALKPGQYLVVPGPDVVAPYLADPLATGIAVASPAGHDVATVPFRGTWPDVGSVAVNLQGVVADGATAFTVTEAGSVVTVTLAPAEVLALRTSCTIGAESLDLMAIWALLDDPTQRQLAGLATNGQHWMLTPGEDLVFVHAVEQPLARPTVAVASVVRELGGTTAAFIGQIGVHAKSTGRADLLAEWQEPLDDPAQPAPITISGRAHITDVAVKSGEDVVAIAQRDVPGANPPVHLAQHDFGDTRYRELSCHVIATTRFRDHFPPEIANDPARITQVGEAVPTTILSTRRPAPPDVAYVIPTFGWEQQVAAGPARTVTRTRRSGGLRVYLNRPWYSSGDGEQLAVVLLDQTAPRPSRPSRPSRPGRTGKPARRPQPLSVGDLGLVHDLSPGHQVEALATPGLDRYVTQWGIDPAWEQKAAPPSGPRAEQLTGRAGFRAGLTLGELPGRTVAVALHDVVFDAERGLWRADVELKMGDSYFPFVRLALARYQAHSLATAELSPVVLADFAQVPPERAATVRPLPKGLVDLTVTGPAPARLLDGPPQRSDPQALLPAHTDGAGLITAQVERLPVGATDLGWVALGDPVVLTPDRTLGHDGPNPVVTWRARFPVPAVAAGERRRLAIREEESLETDPGVAETAEQHLSPVPGERDPTRALARTFTYYRRRLVYADHVDLE